MNIRDKVVATLWQVKLSLRFWRLAIYAFFFPKKYDLIFCADGHFFRSNHDNPELFQKHINACQAVGMKFLLVVVPPLVPHPRKYPEFAVSLPTSIIRLLYILSRIIGLRNDPSDKFIGTVLGRSFFRGVNTRNFVTLANTMASRARWIWPRSRIFDYQHGIVYRGHPGYFRDADRVFPAYGSGRIEFLAWSDRFAEIMQRAGVAQSHCVGLASEHAKRNFTSSSPPCGVIITLTVAEETLLESAGKTPYEISVWSDVIDILLNTPEPLASFVYAREHPRAPHGSDYARILTQKGAIVGRGFADLEEREIYCHLTLGSTSAFEFSQKGIPTLFIAPDPIVGHTDSRKPAEFFELVWRQLGFPRGPVKAADIQIHLRDWRNKPADWERAAIEDREWSARWIETFDPRRWLELLDEEHSESKTPGS